MEKKTVELEHLVKVESSNIDMVGFKDDETYVMFKNGGIYKYSDTDINEFQDLATAKSVGGHFAKSYRLKPDYEKLENTELKKKKMTAEELENDIIRRLDHYTENNMNEASTGVKRMLVKRLIAVVQENS